MMRLRSSSEILALLGPLRRYARALTRDEGLAEDLVQDALLRAHERRDTFRKGANLRLWLMSILHNVFIDGLRSRRAERARETAMAQLTPDITPAPQESALRLSQIRAAFFHLPPDQREALHLVGIEGLSYAEAAAVLDIPQGTLMSRISRARAALRAFEDTPRLRIVGGRDERR